MYLLDLVCLYVVCCFGFDGVLFIVYYVCLHYVCGFGLCCLIAVCFVLLWFSVAL